MKPFKTPSAKLKQHLFQVVFFWGLATGLFHGYEFVSQWISQAPLLERPSTPVGILTEKFRSLVQQQFSGAVPESTITEATLTANQPIEIQPSEISPSIERPIEIQVPDPNANPTGTEVLTENGEVGEYTLQANDTGIPVEELIRIEELEQARARIRENSIKEEKPAEEVDPNLNLPFIAELPESEKKTEKKETSNSSGSNGSSAPAESPSDTLTQDDVNLIASSMNGSFSQDQMNNLPGKKCVTGGSCATGKVSTFPLRWDLQNGLLQGTASFSISALSNSNGSIPIQADAKFTLQEESNPNNKHDVPMNLNPTHVSIGTNEADGKSIRIYTIQFSDTSVFGGQSVHGVKAVLVYEMNGTTGTLTSGSHFTFTRTGVKTSSMDFDNSSSRTLASSKADYIIVDTFQTIMNLQK